MSVKYQVTLPNPVARMVGGAANKLEVTVSELCRIAILDYLKTTGILPGFLNKDGDE